MESVREEIERRAYELFMARGGQDGYHIQDWLQAEKEVTDSIAKKQKALEKKSQPAAKATESETPKPKRATKKAATGEAPAKKRVTKKKTA